jgi:CubicO group peptidase (beta-lactamase class C family)
VLSVDALEARIRREIDGARVPGLALALVHGGELVYARGFGVTSVDDGARPVTPGTLFRIGSVTKPMTGTVAMRLVADGRLDLDRPVRAYLPWFALSDPAAAERVTLRMLLSHTAGLPHDHRPYGRRDPEALAARVREEIPRYPLVAPPGTTWSYSNAGIHVAAFLIETALGVPYGQAMDDLLFRPLGMARTTFDVAVAMTYPLAQSHDLDEDGTLRVRRRYADNAANHASGQAISTVLDLVAFARLHLDRGRFGGEPLLPAELVDEMHRPQAEIPAPGRGAYGLTFGVQTHRGTRRVRHGGGITEFGATFDLLPDHGAAVITLRNRLAPELAVDRLVDDLIDQLLGRPPE